MNNTQPMFDPMTGQPINNNVNKQPMFDPMTGQPINNTPEQATVLPVTESNQVAPIQSTITPIEPIPTVDTNTIVQTETTTIQENNALNTQQQMQSIPTVEQSTHDFISNTQALSEEKKEEKKDGPNIAFIVILFVIIFASIFFLFPYLLKL